MADKLLTEAPWVTVRKTIKAARGIGFSAISYVTDVSLLPFRAGSILVVDASLHAVKSGQTSPAELLKLLAKGVRIYSLAGLHAKIVAVGKRAFVGSANASQSSVSQLHEAVLETGTRDAVAQVRRHVVRLAQTAQPELGEAQLKLLAKQYRPAGGFPRGSKARTARSAPDVSPMRLLNLRPYETDEAEDEHFERELKKAKPEMRGRKAGFEAMQFNYSPAKIADGEIVLTIFHEEDGRIFVEPPARIIRHVRNPYQGKRAFAYTGERRSVRRIELERFKRLLGYGPRAKILRRGGMIGDANLRLAILDRFGGLPMPRAK